MDKEIRTVWPFAPSDLESHFGETELYFFSDGCVASGEGGKVILLPMEA